jgi:hypothetical protein
MSGASALRASGHGHPRLAKLGWGQAGRGWTGALLVLLGGAACRGVESSNEPTITAEFGIFYGGQVQEREQIPFDLDRTRQTSGFRLRRSTALDQPLEIRWELGMPGSGRAVADSRGRVARPRRVQLGRARWRPGEAVFEQVLPFAPGDPPGLWNIRILCGSRAVLDRPFWVYDPAQRQLSEAADAG